MKTISLWAVTSNTDLTEGRGSEYDVGYFDSESNAISTVVDSRYRKFLCMGMQSPDDKKYKVAPRVFAVYDTPDEFFAEHATVERIKNIMSKIGVTDMQFLIKYLQSKDQP